MMKKLIIVVSLLLTLSAAASATSGTREDPIPMGAPVELDDGWQVTVLDVLPDATNTVLQENQFNKGPREEINSS